MPIKIKFALKQTLELAIVLLLCSILIFTLVTISPIDPLTSNYGANLTSKMSEEKIENLKNYWGVSKPIYESFLTWLKNISQGNFGVSLLYNEPVIDVIFTGFKNSAPVIAISWLISGIFGYFFAIYSSIKHRSITSSILNFINYVLISVPQFWLGILFLIIFSVNLGLFKVLGTTNLESAILPCIVLVLTSTPAVYFHSKAKCDEIFNSDYVKHAQNKGLNKKEIVLHHVIKNASFPSLSIQFAQIGEIIGGSIVVEQVFSYPGLGQITLNAATNSDVTLLAGISFFTCILVFFGNLLCKLIMLIIDPRLKQS